MNISVLFNCSVTEELVKNAIAGSCVRILINSFFFFFYVKLLFSFETSYMIGIPDITVLHSLITVSEFFKAVEKSSNKTTAISLETNQVKHFITVTVFTVAFYLQKNQPSRCLQNCTPH